MNATYRIALASDRHLLARLRSELWPHCSVADHEQEISQLLESPGVIVLAEIQQETAGFAEVSIRSDYVEGASEAPVPYLEGWYVREGFRRRGVGRGLLSFVEAWAVAQGHRELASDAELMNDSSIRLHGQFGFSEVGRSVHFVKQLKSSDA